MALCGLVLELKRRFEDVAAEYAERLAIGALWQRVALNRQINGEIKRRVAEQIAARKISPDALY